MRHLFLLIFIVCIGCNYLLIEKLHTQRDTYKLSVAPSLEGVPPEIALATTVLGAFRGLLVDALWLRATSMRDKGEFFELVQISDWIGKLEPRMPKIWAFNAWNLAYNISVELPTPPERWNWVQQGMKVLRDKGIPYNPRDAALYEELAWILYHKVGQYTDDHNNYYKLQLADEVDRIMQGKSATEIQEKYPEIAQKLAQTLKLDVAFMAELEKRYSFFDWRFPDALAIYWAQKGRPFAQSSIMKNMDRITYSALQNCFRRGRIILARDKEGVATAWYSVPHFAFLRVVLQQFDNDIATFGRQVGLISAYKYFLEEVVSTSYIYDNKKSLKTAVLKLREVFPHDKKYKRPVHAIAQSMLRESIKESSRDDLHNYILGYLTNAYIHLGWGELDASHKMVSIAADLYQYFEKEFQSKGQQLPSFNALRSQALRQAFRMLPPVLRKKLESLASKEPANSQKSK